MVFASVPISDLDAAYAIEAASYLEDEAASCEGMLMRLQQASAYFIGRPSPPPLPMWTDEATGAVAGGGGQSAACAVE